MSTISQRRAQARALAVFGVKTAHGGTLEECQEPQRVCAVCAEVAYNKCLRCQSEWYCTREHQKVAYQAHKKACRSLAASRRATEDIIDQASRGKKDINTSIRAFLQCTRCLDSCSAKGHCRVPHPPHLQQDVGSLFGGGNIERGYHCLACGSKYWVTTSSAAPNKQTVVSGPSFCFDGKHSAGPMSVDDDRRVFPHALSFVVSPRLQAQLDLLPTTRPDLETLTIARRGYYEQGAIQLRLNPVSLPRLVSLQLIDVAFKELVLTEATTPCLESLRLQNINDSCDVTVVLPRLREVTTHYIAGPSSWVQGMLSAAIVLESFDSYKLVGFGCAVLTFASTELRSIDIHRSDCLQGISIWAPRLESLALRACYAMRNIDFPETHALATHLPADFKATSFDINIVNAKLDRDTLRALKRNPRARRPPHAHSGFFEGLFSKMHGMGGLFELSLGSEDGDGDDFGGHDDDDDDFGEVDFGNAGADFWGDGDGDHSFD